MRKSNCACGRTSVGLLNKLHLSPVDVEAWEDFVEQYGPRLYDWCRRWGLQHTDAEDVAQDILLDLARQLPTFQYDRSRSFRGWLRVVARRAWYRFVTSHTNHIRGSGDSQMLSVINSVDAGEDLQRQFEEQYEVDLLGQASARVRLRSEPKTWEAFQLLVYQQLSGAEVARRTGMAVPSVYAAKYRIQKMLKQEMRRLETGCGLPR